MSLNSLQDNMSRRAASMAAMAKRATNPQDIQAIQKSLVDGVQNGSIQPYVGIPLIQELTQRLTEAKTQMAQSMASAGMQQPQGQQGAPIAQQVMQQAVQESQGLEALPSNLPQEYAGGGIIAFEEGGEVERFQFGGTTAQVGQLGYEQLVRLYQTDPALAREAALRAGPIGKRFLAEIKAAGRTSIPLAVGTTGLALSGKARNDLARYTTPEQRQEMANNPMLSAMSGDAGLAGAIMDAPNGEKPAMSYGNQMGNALSFLGKTVVGAPGDAQSPQGYGISRLLNSSDASVPPTVTPTATPAVETKYDPKTATRRSAYSEKNASPAVPAISAIPSNSGFKMPDLTTMKETAAPVLTDLDAITKDMDKKTKTAAEAAVKASQAELEAMDKPGFEAREARLGKREAAQEKDSAIGRFLNLMSTGLKVAGSKERTVAGALGKEGSEGIADLIRGEAANRAAKDKLEDYRDNLEQQKIAAKKGNYQAAQAAGERAADNLYKYTNLNLNAASAGNTQAIQRTQLQQQGEFQRASLKQSGDLGIAELGLKRDTLNQNALIANAQLANNLAVAQVKANRESGITPYQMSQLRIAAEKNVDPGAVRAALAKKFKMSKAPVPGADASFDDKFKIAYENEMTSYINRVLGTPGGGGGDFGAVDSLVDKYAPKR
jgi:hypothetical protein